MPPDLRHVRLTVPCHTPSPLPGPTRAYSPPPVAVRHPAHSVPHTCAKSASQSRMALTCSAWPWSRAWGSGASRGGGRDRSEEDKKAIGCIISTRTGTRIKTIYSTMRPSCPTPLAHHHKCMPGAPCISQHPCTCMLPPPPCGLTLCPHLLRRLQLCGMLLQVHKRVLQGRHRGQKHLQLGWAPRGAARGAASPEGGL